MIDLKELDNDPWSTFPTKKDDLRALVAAVTWQPIETAPKDDTDMLLFCGDGICIGSYAAGMFWFVQNDYELRDPTHWMPLPKPPKGGDK